MSERLIEIRGETYVSLEQVASWYEVEVAWVYEVCEYGLLGPGERVGETVVVMVAVVDRVAEIRRLYALQGVNLPGIALLLGPLEAPADLAARR